MKQRAALFLAALLLLWSSATAQVPSSNRIAFVTLEGRLATIASDGTDLRLLTPPGPRFQFPAWSPDGRRIAAIAADGLTGYVYVVPDAEDAEASVLYSSQAEPPIYLYWSPDGSVLSFIANHGEGLGLHLAEPAGEGARLLATGQPFYWQWSADGRDLFIHTGFAGPGARLGFTGIVEDDLETNLAPPGFFQAPGISPSGRYLAYAEVDTFRGKQLILASLGHGDQADQEALRREVPHRGLVAFSWSPTKDELAFISPPEEVPHYYGPLQLLDAETGLLELLTAKAVLAFFWSPDGRYIAYLTPASPGGQDVAATGADGTLYAAAAQPQQAVRLELALIDVAQRSERSLATVFASPLFVGQFLPFFDQYALSHQLWSPAGDALVMSVVGPDGLPRVSVISLDGTVTPIAEGVMPFWNRR